MAEAKQEADWWHTASVLSLIVNVNRDPKKGKPSKPSDFHPMHAKPTKDEGLSFEELKRAFGVKKPSKESQDGEQ